MRNLWDIISQVAEKYALKKSFVQIDGDGNPLSVISFHDFHEKVNDKSLILISNLDAGSRVLLLFSDSIEFVVSFFACIKACMIPVPCYPFKNKRGIEKIKLIIDDAQINYILTDFAPSIKYYEDIYSYCQVNSNKANRQRNNINDYVHLSDIAFLQYTSGSTGNPKGVIITHDNIISNLELIERRFRLSDKSIFVSWLPFYHDMGLVGNIISPLYIGATCYIYQPVDFIKNPLSWLRIISKYKATISGAPNFAYELCLSKTDDKEKEKMDLSSWNCAYNGAEPIHPKTIREFANKFESAGFKKESILSCYGMAESTLLISAYEYEFFPKIRNFGIINQKDETLTYKELVSCGKPIGYDLKIIDDNNNILNEGRVGEIIVFGKSVTPGYWNNGSFNNQDLYIQFENQNKKYLKTGDLGIIHKGELYITGRKKDLIIINGKNYYPNDIEYLIYNNIEDVANNACAAFSINENDKEEIVVVAEVHNKPNNPTKLIKKIKELIFQEFEFAVKDIVLIKRGTLHKTTSGKIQRHKCKQAYLNNELMVLASNIDIKFRNSYNARLTDNEIVYFLRNYLKDETISPKSTFSDLALDSIKVMQFQSLFREKLALEFPLELLFSHSTFHEIYKSKSKYKITPHNKINSSIINNDLSYAQRAIWTITQIFPNTNAYNIPVRFEFESSLNIDVLNKSIAILQERYNILRTVFCWENDKPIRVLKESLPVLASLLNSKNDDTKSLKINIRKFIRRKFDLANGPLLRLLIINESSNSSYIIFVFHHIIADGSSIKQLIKEFKLIYEFIIKDTPKKQELQTIQYDAFVEWEKINLEKVSIDQRAYWKDQLSGLGPRTRLILDRSHINSVISKGHSLWMSLEKDISNSIIEMSKNLKVSVFSILFSTFSYLVYKLTGNNDIIICLPVSLRDREEWKKAPGIFLNTIFLRTKINEDYKINEFIKETNFNILNGLKHKDYPLSLLLNDLGIRSRPGEYPLSSIFFNGLTFLDESENAKESMFLNSGLEMNFEVNCYTYIKKDEISFRLDYMNSLFNKESIHIILEKYKDILSQISINSNQSLSQIKTNYVNQITSPINDASWYKDKVTIVDIFVQKATQFPNKVAIVFEDIIFTYAKLNELTDKWANILLTHVNQRDSRAIGIFVEHNHNMAISTLAVLKAGFHYLPFDWTFPKKRIEEVIHETSLTYIIVDNVTELRFSGLDIPTIKLLNIEDFSKLIDVPNSSIRPKINQESLAYILFTSGSTGKPKGVMQNHKNLLHFISQYSSFLKITEKDRLTGFSSISYDSFNNDFYGSILNAAIYCPISIHKGCDSDELHSWLCKHFISIYHSTPTIFSFYTKKWITQGKKLDYLRIVKMTGESVQNDLFLNFKQLVNKFAHFVVSLGSTESTLSTINSYSVNSKLNYGIVPVGENIGRTHVFIGNEQRKPFGVLEVGEIIVKSDYVSPGYLNDIKTNNIYKVNQSTYYHTGDYGRKLPNGKIQCLFRGDNQVKIRGYRIELAEVEKRIMSFNNISEVVVIKNEEDIYAFYTSNNRINVNELRRYLLNFLPYYMIPNHFKQVEKIPLTTSGKANYQELMSLDINQQIKDEQFCENEVQMILLGILNKILPVKISNINESFFELGVKSIDLLLFSYKIEKHFNLKEQLINLYKYPTIKLYSENVIIGKTSNLIEQDSQNEKLMKKKDMLKKKSLLWDYEG